MKPAEGIRIGRRSATAAAERMAAGARTLRAMARAPQAARRRRPL
jgi:hypothetical protein